MHALHFSIAPSQGSAKSVSLAKGMTGSRFRSNLILVNTEGDSFRDVVLLILEYKGLDPLFPAL